MNLIELQEKINEYPLKERLETRKLNINIPHLGITKTLTGLVSIYEFISRQIAGFNSFKKVPPEIESLKNQFAVAQKKIIDLVNNPNLDESQLNNSLAFLTSKPARVFLHDSPETEFLVQVNENNPTAYQGAYDFLIGTLSHLSNKNYFTGYLLASEFQTKDYSKLLERKNAEEKSIERIRNDFHQFFQQTQQEVARYFKSTGDQYQQYTSQLDTLKNEKENAFTSWFETSEQLFNTFHNESVEKIKKSEELYIEKLKLEAPAQYWHQRAMKLRSEGRKWLTGMISCLVASIILLFMALNMIANGTLTEIFTQTSTAVKWSVVFITVISFLAYGIRTFAKLTFSSFHLVRDAEEREQLTYVYLALKKEGNIDPTERHLIMQSLFSRADSGLLKDDSGPTMPGHIMDNIPKK